MVDYKKMLGDAKEEPSYWIALALIEFTSGFARQMKDRGITQKHLAQLMGVKPPTVSKWLRGTENLTVGTMCKLAFALDAAVHIHVANKEDRVRVLDGSLALRGDSNAAATAGVPTTARLEANLLPFKPKHPAAEPVPLRGQPVEIAFGR